ncbi:Integral membrane protein, putative [Trichomonas vaginalis G3]|uniref:Integral membrane protein, putative n=1 Tax=Trichomonas vaginalis (strain ATCC PRA-98 / G3) TaxID=412133 RepID=A2G6P3_TRIV3|nr:EamA-like transporter family [Trichomonas vaginalis G3]EAX87167.1 Integral membrane protein, putative [Trichomonas vaginalis G3]KAI5540206.1 EamA-like transporter family [Trichomonas vaginalis G3]|eukprot:XP_001300097.1 Integral membrane protein [Trichomonas vaginalis G3]
MQCTLWVAISFVFCATVYGASSAAAAEGIKYWTPEMLIMGRMLWGFIFCLFTLIFRIIFEDGYKQICRAHFLSGPWPYINIAIGGLLNLGIPHSLIYIAQQWIPSAAVQLSKPLQPLGSIIANCILPIDEKLTLHKGLALLSAIIGVSLGAVPSFRHTHGKASGGQVGLGYALLVLAMILFGAAASWFRWRTPNVDITISSLLQTFFSFWFDMIWSLIMDGPKKFRDTFINCTAYGWIWPVLLGVLGSGMAVHGFMYLVAHLGSVGAGFIPFAQIIVGVTIGVVILHEWKGFLWWEIFLNVLGLIFLALSLVIGFMKDKDDMAQQEKHGEEEEEHAHGEEEQLDETDELAEL